MSRSLRVRRTQNVAARGLARPLLDEIARQQGAWPACAARERALQRLGQPGTAVVVTGQQVGLFGGPLYTVYKAATAIAVARALEAESGVACVPLFWLQTEDHDFAEIAWASVLGAEGPARVTAQGATSGPAGRVSVAHRTWGADVEGALAVVQAALAGLPCADETLAALRDAYRPGRPVAHAFAALLTTIFPDEGLLFLDPRTPAVAGLARPLYATAIERADAIATCLVERSRALRAAGHPAQVRLRPGHTLLFFHEGDPEGPRHRLPIELPASRRAEVEAALASRPLRFSTSALLRPLVQDALLPVGAYVGGPAELAYFEQLGPVYSLFGLPEPLPVPRASFRVVDAKARSLLDRLGLQAAEMERPLAELVHKLSPLATGAHPSPVVLREAFARAAGPALDELGRAAVAVDAHLERPARRARERVLGAVDRLVARYERALVDKDAILAGRLARAVATFFPHGVPQEREYSWASMAARHGVRAFSRAVIDAVVPFDGARRELAL